MERIIKCAEPEHLEASAELVESVFTESEGEESGKLVRAFVEEIRSKRFYLPELELIEEGFVRAKAMGYEAVIAEGDPRNYRARGFKTSFDHGIVAGESIGLLAVECLMVKELVEGSLKNIKGVVSYADYQSMS